MRHFLKIFSEFWENQKKKQTFSYFPSDLNEVNIIYFSLIENYCVYRTSKSNILFWERKKNVPEKLWTHVNLALNDKNRRSFQIFFPPKTEWKIKKKEKEKLNETKKSGNKINFACYVKTHRRNINEPGFGTHSSLIASTTCLLHVCS